MNCQQFWNSASDSDLGKEQSAHLAECASCARSWEKQQVVRAGLRALAADSRNVEAPPRVEARLVAAFRADSGLGQVRPGSAGRPRMWVPVVTWFAAAAAVVLVALAVMSGHPPQPAHRNLSPRIESATVISADASGADEPGYNAEDFIPLPNAQQLSPDEDVNLVRVELQRSSMIPLGYDVSADRASELVEAEVVLGSDGVARAVRFLDE